MLTITRAATPGRTVQRYGSDRGPRQFQGSSRECRVNLNYPSQTEDPKGVSTTNAVGKPKGSSAQTGGDWLTLGSAMIFAEIDQSPTRCFRMYFPKARTMNRLAPPDWTHFPLVSCELFAFSESQKRFSTAIGSPSVSTYWPEK